MSMKLEVLGEVRPAPARTSWCYIHVHVYMCACLVTRAQLMRLGISQNSSSAMGFHTSIGLFTYTLHVHVYVHIIICTCSCLKVCELWFIERYRRKKEASKVIQTTGQSNTTHPRQSLSPRKNELRTCTFKCMDV